MDASYKSDMREMNELNFARFDAKQEQRLAALDAKFEQRLTTIDGKIDLTAARLTAALEKGLREQTRFFFLAWGVLLASNIALWFR